MHRRHSESSCLDGQAHAWTDGWMAGTIMGRNKEWRDEEPGLPGVLGPPHGDHIWPMIQLCFMFEL